MTRDVRRRIHDAVCPASSTCRYSPAWKFPPSAPCISLDKLLDELEDACERPRLMGTAEVVAYMDISYTRLYVLRRKPGFPQPTAVLASGPTWLATDIEDYQAHRRRTPGQPCRSEIGERA